MTESSKVILFGTYDLEAQTKRVQAFIDQWTAEGYRVKKIQSLGTRGNGCVTMVKSKDKSPQSTVNTATAEIKHVINPDLKYASYVTAKANGMTYAAPSTAEAKPVAKFKVGDKVKIVDREMIRNNEVGEVIGIDDTDIPVSVAFRDGESWYRADSVQLADSEIPFAERSAIPELDDEIGN